jgi:hypothetical protein
MSETEKIVEEQPEITPEKRLEYIGELELMFTKVRESFFALDSRMGALLVRINEPTSNEDRLDAICELVTEIVGGYMSAQEHAADSKLSTIMEKITDQESIIKHLQKLGESESAEESEHVDLTEPTTVTPPNNNQPKPTN